MIQIVGNFQIFYSDCCIAFVAFRMQSFAFYVLCRLSTHLTGGEAECDRPAVDIHLVLGTLHRAAVSSLHAVPERSPGVCHPPWRDTRPQGLLLRITS